LEILISFVTFLKKVKKQVVILFFNINIKF